MKTWQLVYEKEPFTPQLVRGSLNTGASFSAQELQDIRRQAFPDNPLLQQSSAMVLPKMFASGLCTGMSAWTLLRFAQRTQGLEELTFSAILQARILRPTVWQQALGDYTQEADPLLAQLTTLMTSDEYQDFPLLMIIPRIKNILHLACAHTLVPYRIAAQGNLYQIWVYDCNAPGDPHCLLKWDRLSGCWKYGHFHSGQWYIAVMPLAFLL